MEARHIQDFSNASASSLEPHWGYADRIIPCTNDPGSCSYLDVVYAAHDVGMLYMGIFWGSVIAILFAWALAHRLKPTRTSLAISSTIRKYLLPEFRSGRWLFGRATRLQVVVLGLMAAYLFVLSFAGMKYATWITPVKNSPGVYNTRTSLGPWSDRVGVLAYALTPLSILLSSRESLLSVITGLPYHHFNFLHRWLGHIIFIQSAMHTIGWCIVEIRLYQPQPSTAIEWIVQPYIIWGVVAMILLCLLWGLSTKWAIRAFGYEFFKKAHYVLAMIYIGACIAHWSNLQCFLIPSLLIWGIDRAIRLGRTALIHYHILPDGKGLFKSIDARLTHYPDGIVRVDFDNDHQTQIQTSWTVGQHFYLTFSKSSIWQSHPFTPLSAPSDPTQSYLLRAKRGETKKVAAFASDSTPLILSGPYGTAFPDLPPANANVLCVAGGTGITFVLPLLLQLARAPKGLSGQIELIWVVRHRANTEWIQAELDELRASGRVRIGIFATRDHTTTADVPAADVEKAFPHTESSFSGSSSSSTHAIQTPSSEQPEKSEQAGSLPSPSLPVLPPTTTDTHAHITPPSHVHPDLHAAVRDFVASTEGGSSVVYTSGPAGVISAVREEVARLNDPRKVWRGVESGRVELVYDERLD